MFNCEDFWIPVKQGDADPLVLLVVLSHLVPGVPPTRLVCYIAQTGASYDGET